MTTDAQRAQPAILLQRLRSGTAVIASSVHVGFTSAADWWPAGRYRTLSTSDEFADDGEGALGRIRNHPMAAVWKALEPHEMVRQRCSNVRLSLNGYHEVVFTAQHKRRALDIVQLKEEGGRATLSATVAA